MGKLVTITDPTMSYWKVGLRETVGTVTVEGVIQMIPAREKEEAAAKALLYHMMHNPGSRPSLRFVELEDISKPIQV